LMAVRPDSISVSLNAATAAEHAKETQVPGVWNRVLEGIRLARRVGLPIWLSRVCTTQNLKGVPKFLELAENLGVQGVDLHNLLPHDVSTPDKLNAFLRSVLTVADSERAGTLRALPGAQKVRSWPVLIDPDVPVRRCDLIFTAIAVDGNRNLSICNSIQPPLPGTVNLRDLKIWQSDYFRAFRERFAKEELEPWCRYCFRNWC